MPKIIGFLGNYPADICMYTAYALQNTGSSVCVADNSQDGILYGCVPAPDVQADSVTFHGVDFVREKPLVQWHELDYDYVLVQLGARPQELCLASCSERVLVVDCDRRSLDFYHQYMQESGMTMSVLLRGYCPEGVSAKVIKERLAVENCFIEKWMTLPFHEMDEAYRIGMQYEPVSRFAYISLGMEKVLMQILCMAGAGSPSGAIRAVKHAKKGRMAVLLHKGAGVGPNQEVAGVI